MGGRFGQTEMQPLLGSQPPNPYPFLFVTSAGALPKLKQVGITSTVLVLLSVDGGTMLLLPLYWLWRKMH